MAGGMLLFLGSILLVLLTIVSVIFSIIYFANSKKGKFVWLAIFLGSLAGAVFCIFLLVTTISKSVQRFGDRIGSMIPEPDQPEGTYNFADSTNSKHIKYLKEMEPAEFKGRVPEQFYNYLGFANYYRLPLRYPFSLHCEDQLTNALLFNEQDVKAFNINDNGEKDCGFHYISEFAFDENILLVKLLKKDAATRKNLYALYYFSSGETEQFKSQAELIKRARELKFTKSIKLISCEDYYQLLK